MNLLDTLELKSDGYVQLRKKNKKEYELIATGTLEQLGEIPDSDSLWQKDSTGKWWRLSLSYHYDESNNQILDYMKMR